MLTNSERGLVRHFTGEISLRKKSARGCPFTRRKEEKEEYVWRRKLSNARGVDRTYKTKLRFQPFYVARFQHINGFFYAKTFFAM